MAEPVEAFAFLSDTDTRATKGEGSPSTSSGKSVLSLSRALKRPDTPPVPDLAEPVEAPSFFFHPSRTPSHSQNRPA